MRAGSRPRTGARPRAILGRTQGTSR